jgi:hypothetical protein
MESDPDLKIGANNTKARTAAGPALQLAPVVVLALVAELVVA